jgi:hypothetical protein
VDKSAALCTALVQFNQFNAAPQLLPEELNGFPDEIKAPADERQTLSHYIFSRSSSPAFLTDFTMHV